MIVAIQLPGAATAIRRIRVKATFSFGAPGHSRRRNASEAGIRPG
jgi:hypothetical protein